MQHTCTHSAVHSLLDPFIRSLTLFVASLTRLYISRVSIDAFIPAHLSVLLSFSIDLLVCSLTPYVMIYLLMHE